MHNCEKSYFRNSWRNLVEFGMGYEVIVIHAINTRDKAGPFLWRVNLTIEIWSIYAKKRGKKSFTDPCMFPKRGCISGLTVMDYFLIHV